MELRRPLFLSCRQRSSASSWPHIMTTANPFMCASFMMLTVLSTFQVSLSSALGQHIRAYCSCRSLCSITLYGGESLHVATYISKGNVALSVLMTTYKSRLTSHFQRKHINHRSSQTSLSFLRRGVTLLEED